MSAAPAKTARVPTSTRYEFHEPIGTGGMGTVYRGRDRISGWPVAIKVLKAHLSENPAQHYRFAQEFRSATRLEHPNIVRALDFGTDGLVSFLVFELVEGVSLGDRVDNQGKLPEWEAVRIITQVAQALHYAHLRRVIHRDVKPDNVLLLPDGRAKLTDFGLAKDYENDQNLTRQASGLGTPHFMAPEQFVDAKSASILCDVYSLGATLYNLVTGHVPFEKAGGVAALARKAVLDVPSARALAPELSDRADAAIRAALQPDPKKRPINCLEFFKLLTARPKFEGEELGDPLAATPAGAADRRVYARHPMTLGACGTVDTGVHPGGRDAEEAWPLVLKDVSAGGVGLLLARRFEPGTELVLELGPRRVPARVVRVVAGEVGHWVHGCVFPALLAESELADLLKCA